jgi:hypothetical protein
MLFLITLHAEQVLYTKMVGTQNIPGHPGWIAEALPRWARHHEAADQALQQESPQNPQFVLLDPVCSAAKPV